MCNTAYNYFEEGVLKHNFTIEEKDFAKQYPKMHNRIANLTIKIMS